MKIHTSDPWLAWLRRPSQTGGFGNFHHTFSARDVTNNLDKKFDIGFFEHNSRFSII